MYEHEDLVHESFPKPNETRLAMEPKAMPVIPNPANTLSIVPAQDAAARTAQDWQRTQDWKKKQ